MTPNPFNDPKEAGSTEEPPRSSTVGGHDADIDFVPENDNIESNLDAPTPMDN